MTAIEYETVGPGWRFTMVRWAAVFAGAIVGLALAALFTALWLALGHHSGGFMARTMNWWIGGTAIAAVLVGGLLAGWLAGARGVIAGFMNGITVWALLLIVALAIGIPGLFGAYTSATVTSGTSTSATSATTVAYSSGVLWTWFWSILIGLGAAGLGGILGGALPQPVMAKEAGPLVERETAATAIRGRRVPRAG